MNEEKKKGFLLRLPAELHAWLKENVKDQTLNDLMVKLLKEYRESFKPAEEEFEGENLEEQWSYIRDKLTPELKELLYAREKILESPEFKAFEEDFNNMEYTLNPENDFGTAYDVKKFSQAAKKYHETLDTLSHENFHLFFKALNVQRELEFKRELERKYHGDPDEVIFREITRSEIYNTFPKDELLSIRTIASKLGLSYNDAYNHIVPWMHRERWKLSIER